MSAWQAFAVLGLAALIPARLTAQDGGGRGRETVPGRHASRARGRVGSAVGGAHLREEFVDESELSEHAARYRIVAKLALESSSVSRVEFAVETPVHEVSKFIPVHVAHLLCFHPR